MHMRQSFKVMLGTAVLALVVGGCSGTADDPPNTSAQDSSASSADDSFPKTVVSGPTDSGVDITIESRPQSIVSLSPTATETLFAIGAGDQVVAVDSQSDYPTDAPKTDLSAYTPSLEAIVGYEPDLVIASDDIGGLVSGLITAQIPTLLLPAATSIDDAYAQIERVGDATGREAEAEAVVEQTRTRIDDAVASVPAGELTYFHELDSELYTVTSQSFVGQLYGLFGLTSIADGAGSNYPQLAAESVVTDDPDVIFLADSQCCGVTAESVATRPGWSSMRAVRDGRIYTMDEDLSSRWGPRIADQVEAIAAVLTGNK